MIQLKISRKRIAIPLLIMAAVIGGVFLLPNKTTVAPDVQQTLVEKALTYSTSTPDESPLENYQWSGAVSEPKKITIPDIGVNAFVQGVAADQNNEIAVPDNINLVGWFVASSLPGEPGLSIIDGHVTGQTTNGIFRRLEELSIGQTFTVERGDGKTLNYKIIAKNKIAAEQSESVLFSQDPKVKSQLNLITCGGDFNTNENEFSDRVIISAALVE